MNVAQTIHSLDLIKALADEHRLAIMARLMSERATLSQLAESLHHSPAWIRHHLLVLQKAGLVELIEVRKSGRVTEKYYQANASAYLLQRWVVPLSDKPSIIFSGSHDLAMELLSTKISERIKLILLPVGSLNGLIYLRQGVCQLAGAHILDSSSGEYNLPTLRQLFPGVAVQVVTLAHRTQGLMVAPGNPKGIRSLSDLIRSDVRFANRNTGSGTRIWLEMSLSQQGISKSQISGFELQIPTHHQAAQMVQEGTADVSLGLEAAAYRCGLDFIPLFEERYDLVFPEESLGAMTPLLETLYTAGFQKDIRGLPGYNPSHSGDKLSVI